MSELERRTKCSEVERIKTKIAVLTNLWQRIWLEIASIGSPSMWFLGYAVGAWRGTDRPMAFSSFTSGGTPIRSKMRFTHLVRVRLLDWCVGERCVRWKSDLVEFPALMLDPVCPDGWLSLHLADALRVVGMIDSWLWVINRAIVL